MISLTLTVKERNILYGALLGDGCLCIHKNGINAVFQYCSKSSEHTHYMGEYMSRLSSSKSYYDYNYLDNRTNKRYYGTRFRTISNEALTNEYYKWYKDGKKHIPRDLILNSQICLIWYIGDGGVVHSNRSEFIKLSTHCFSKEEQEEILLPQLSRFNPHLFVADRTKDGKPLYAIYIPRKNMSDFLEYIGKCPLKDYEYKWKITAYKNRVPKNHKDKEKIFCDMYNKGMSYYKIAKFFNIEPNAVKYYLTKNNLYKREEDTQ